MSDHPSRQQADDWTLRASEPAAGRLYLANGYMSTALDFSAGVLFDSESAPCYVRGLYSDTGPDGIDELTLVPCWSRLPYSSPATLRDYSRDLLLRTGRARTRFVLEEERGCLQIEHQVILSRHDPHLAVIQLTIHPDFDGELAFVVGLAASLGQGLRTREIGADGGSLYLCTETPKYGVTVAEALAFPEKGWAFEDSIGQNEVSRVLRAHASAGQRIELTQFARVVTSLESADPVGDARQMPSDLKKVTEQHERAWEELWQTDIRIDGDEEAQLFVRAGLFYLRSMIQKDDSWSIAPMGLSSNGYKGHIFWDAELWMYPPLLLTDPAMAQSCVAYREKTLPAAQKRAVQGGFTGAQFPWEGGFTGDEMTPFECDTRDYQLHITADVAIAQWWYFVNTQDLEWLRQHGFPVIRECAKFWVSRVERKAETDRFEISDVVAADEYASHVDNDAFTNASVQKCLLIAHRAAELLGEAAPAEWCEIAERMYVPYDPGNRYHLEFDGYDGSVTKQADVELLAYPLEYVTDSSQVARDLDHYSTVIDPNGPAMSFAIYSIVSAQLGRKGEAYEYFRRSYVPNVRPPFFSFSETPTNNSFLFCTGIGGALQSILFGFTGIRLREGYFILQPVLPEHWRALILTNLFLLGARTDLEIEASKIVINRRVPSGDISVEIFGHGRDTITVLDGTSSSSELLLEVESASGELLLTQTARTSARISLPSRPDDGIRLRVTKDSGEVALDVLLKSSTPVPKTAASDE